MNLPQLALSRRQFFETVDAGALLTAHHSFAQVPLTNQPPRPLSNGNPCILNLELLTSAPLGLMKDFYHKSLGLQVVESRADRLTVAAGLTRLTFVLAAS